MACASTAGIPPRIVKHHVARGREIQAGARGAEAEQKHAGIRVVLERVDDFLPVFGLAGEDVRVDLPLVAFLFQQLQHLHKLAEDENLLALGQQRVEQFKQRFGLAGSRIVADEFAGGSKPGAGA